MNNTIHVSIAGIAFILENEGYRLLKDYLVRIEVGYKGNPDGPEILSDIEARISELILNEQGADTVVATERIRTIIGQLGLPDGADATPASDNEPATGMQPDNFSRRLYRNPDGAKLGGVCNGLATYFRVDPTVVRLIFCSPLLILICISVIPFLNRFCGFFGMLIGVSFLLYFILWFSIPKARTPRQRLEMSGEKITASSIRRNISEDLNAARPSPKNERTASAFSELLYVVGRVLLFCVKAWVLIVGFILTLSVIAVIVGAISFILGGSIVGTPFCLVGIPLHITGTKGVLLAILLLLVVVLPLIIVIYLLMKLVFDLPSRKTTLSVLFGIWILILIYIGVYVVRNYDRLEDAIRKRNIEVFFKADRSASVPVPVIVNDTVRVETVSIGDSTASDTVRIEYYTE